jgi:hypothetical protein
MNATRRRITRIPKKSTARRAPLAATPDVVRLSRVRTALQRISNGFYDRDEVRDRLATAVLKELQKM